MNQISNEIEVQSEPQLNKEQIVEIHKQAQRIAWEFGIEKGLYAPDRYQDSRLCITCHSDWGRVEIDLLRAPDYGGTDQSCPVFHVTLSRHEYEASVVRPGRWMEYFQALYTLADRKLQERSRIDDLKDATRFSPIDDQTMFLSDVTALAAGEIAHKAQSQVPNGKISLEAEFMDVLRSLIRREVGPVEEI